MAKNSNIPLSIHRDFIEAMSKAYKASYQVLEENKKLGIPSPFSLRGKIYYLMPDGRIILKKQEKKLNKPREDKMKIEINKKDKRKSQS
jgi:hypothetical protein